MAKCEVALACFDGMFLGLLRVGNARVIGTDRGVSTIHFIKILRNELCWSARTVAEMQGTHRRPIPHKLGLTMPTDVVEYVGSDDEGPYEFTQVVDDNEYQGVSISGHPVPKSIASSAVRETPRDTEPLTNPGGCTGVGRGWGPFVHSRLRPERVTSPT